MIEYAGTVGALGNIIQGASRFELPHDGGSRLYLALPVDVTVGVDGRLYAITRMDSLFRGAPKRPGLFAEPKEVRYQSGRIFNTDDELLGGFGPEGTGDGQFIWPAGIASDASGRIYVSDEARHDVQVLDPEGGFLARWGAPGEGIGELCGPAGVAIERAGDVLVADARNHRLQRFTAEGRPLGAFGGEGAAPGRLSRPWGVAVDASGNVYVADWGNDRVQKLDPDGRPLAVFGVPGSGPEGLRRPSGVAVAGDGTVYVADRGNNRVQVFDREGRHVMALLGAGTLTPSGRKWYDDHTVRRDQRAAHAEAVALQERSFREPTAAKLDRAGRLLVVDTGRHRIQLYRT